ncbi:MAG: hypothetical protein DMF58_08630, partial [Acidobacteria bacterium]
RPASGEIRIGARTVTKLSANRRPLLFVTSRIDAPGRWSVGHLLIAAVRQRTLDRIDRHREYELAIAKWTLNDLVERPLRTLSSSESAIAQLGRIELLRPGIVIADRLLEHLNPAVATSIADEFYRTLRVIGTTLISAPASVPELGLMDRIVVLDRGRVVQEGSPASVYRRPNSEASAMASSWSAHTTFQGSGVALARPEDFSIAAAGEESDLIFGIEEASFRDGRWIATGILTGAINLRVALPGDLAVHKGRLVPLRYDSSRFVLLPSHPR